MKHPTFPPAAFVVGVARSGTTLLRLMLDAHPELAIPPETGFLLPYFARRGWARWWDWRSWLARGVTRDRFLRQVTRYHTFAEAGVPAADFAQALRELPHFDLAAGSRAFYRLYAQRHGKSLWGDKTPLYGYHLPELRQLFPEARFIHLIRDGRDVAVSLREVWFAPGQDIHTLARYWQTQVEATRAAGTRDPFYLEVAYEQLVREPGPTLRQICDFLELPYHLAMERYDRTAEMRLQESWRNTDPAGVERRRAQQAWALHPPEPSRIARWREALTPADAAAFEQLAGPLLRDLGYP